MGKLDGKKIAVLFTDGVEQVELEKPVDGIKNEGAEVTYLTLEAGEVRPSTPSSPPTRSRSTTRSPTPTPPTTTACCCPAASRTPTSSAWTTTP